MALNLKARPTTRLLEKHLAHVATDTPFRSWCRLKQSLFRQSQGWSSGIGGRHPRALGNYLAEAEAENGKNFLDSSIFDAAKRRLDDREVGDVIERRRLLLNMLTSQALCFNLFLPQGLDLSLATTIWTRLMPNRVAEVTNVKVEHAPGRGHETLGTGDHSAFDAWIEYVHRDGSTGFLAVETKYTEPFSGPCGDPTPRQSDRVKSTGLFTDAGWSQVQKLPTQQLWRTHLLAETMRNAHYRHVTYVVLYAVGDDECSTVLPRYAETLSHHRQVNDLFQPLTLESLVTLKEALSGTNAEWLNKFTERYLDWTAVELEVERSSEL